MAIAYLGYRVDSKEVAKAEERLDRMDGAAGNAEKSSKRLRVAFAAAATAAVASSALFLKSAISEARKFETAMLGLDGVIEATGGAAGRSADQLREQARSIALSTLESTEGVLKAQQTLLTFRKIQGDVFDDTIKAATDMSAALGVDMNSAVLQLGKALEDPITGMTALTRSGTVFTQEQKDMVRQLVETGRQAEAQAFILSELEAQYGGVAEAAAGGLAGAQDTLGQAFQELKLDIADSLGLLALATAANNAAADAINWLAENIDGARGFIIAAAVGLTAFYTPAIIAATFQTGVFIAGLVTLKGALIATGIGAFVVGAGFLINKIIEASTAIALTETAMDNNTIAMGDQIKQSALLASRTSDGNVMTIESARVNLESAKARLEDVVAMERQQELQARQDLGLDKLFSKVLDARAALSAARNDLTAEDIEHMEKYGEAYTSNTASLVRELEAMLVDRLAEQKAAVDRFNQMSFLTEEQKAQQAQAIANIDTLEAGIAEVRDGLVTFNGEVVTGVNLTNRLASAAGNIKFTDAIAGAQRLSAKLDVSLHAAMKIMGLVGGISRAPDVENLDPRGVTYGTTNAEANRAAAAEASSTLDRVRGIMVDIQAESTSTAVAIDDVSTSFAGGGGGGGAAGATRELTTELTAAQKAAKEFADQMSGYVTSAVDGVANAFGDFVMRGFRDFKGFTRSILDSFKQMLSQMISLAARNRIMISLGLGGGGGGATSALAGGGGGGGGALGGIGAVAGALGGGFGNAAGALLGSGGGFGAMFSSIGAQLGTAAATGTATSIAAAAGAVALPLLAVAAAISLFIPRIKELDKGVRVTADGLEVSIEQFRKIQKSRLFGLIKSTSTNFKDAADDVANPIRDAIGDMQGSALEAARVFGFGAGIFDEFSSSFKVSLKGLSEKDALEKVNAELAKMGDEFASLVPNFENMNDLINAANRALAETAAMGSTRFESQVLAAARRRGEITMDRSGPGFAEGQSLIRLQKLEEIDTKVEENTRQNNRLTQKMVDLLERWEEVGIPRGPVLT